MIGEPAETITVRDHSKPCEHGSLWPHWITLSEAKWWQEPECLGGRAMRLRRQPDGSWVEIESGGAEH